MAELIYFFRRTIVWFTSLALDKLGSEIWTDCNRFVFRSITRRIASNLPEIWTDRCNLFPLGPSGTPALNLAEIEKRLYFVFSVALHKIGSEIWTESSCFIVLNLLNFSEIWIDCSLFSVSFQELAKFGWDWEKIVHCFQSCTL